MLGKIWVKRNFGQQNFVEKKYRVEKLIINIVCKYQNIILWLGVYWYVLCSHYSPITFLTTHRFILKIISAHVMIFAVLVMIVPVYIKICNMTLEGVIQLYQGHYALITYFTYHSFSQPQYFSALGCLFGDIGALCIVFFFLN